jgi:competence protein ComEA
MKYLSSLGAMLLLLCVSSVALAKRPPSAPAVTGVANLNTASEKMLEALPAVGPSRAKAIVAYRQEHKFTKIEDVRKVKGVGKGVFAKIKPHVSVSGPNTLAKIASKSSETSATSATSSTN